MQDEVESTEEVFTEALTIGQIRHDWVTKFGRQKNRLSARREEFDTAVLSTEMPIEPTKDEPLSPLEDANRALQQRLDELENEKQVTTEYVEGLTEKLDTCQKANRDGGREVRRLNDLVGEQQDRLAKLEQQLADPPRVAALKTARGVLASSSVAGMFSAKTIDPDHLIKVADWILLADGGPSTWRGILAETFGQDASEDTDGGEPDGEMLPVEDLTAEEAMRRAGLYRVDGVLDDCTCRASSGEADQDCPEHGRR